MSSISGQGDIDHSAPRVMTPEESDLESKVVSIRTFLRAHNNISSNRDGEPSLTEINSIDDPTRRLPNEVVSLIFGYCLPVLGKGLPNAIFYGIAKTNTRTLFRLGVTCTRCRQIGWTTPRLWSFIFIDLKTHNLVSSTVMAKEWLERSRKVPLTVEVNYTETLFFNGHGDSPVEHRWENLDLQLPSRLLKLFSGTPSGLREILIQNTDLLDTWGNNEYIAPPEYIGSLSTAKGVKPAPTYVETHEIQFKTIDISWNNVTRVETSGLYIQEVVELLLQAPLLEHGTFNSLWSHGLSGLSIGGPLKTDVRSAIQSLRIYCPKEQSLKCLFFENILTLPGLKVLHVHLEVGYLMPHDFEAFLKRSAFTLNTLGITGNFDNNNLIPILRLVRPIRSLCIELGRYNLFSAKLLCELIARTSGGFYNGISVAGGYYGPFRTNFLPELVDLQYNPIRPEECNDIWDLIPNLFGTQADDCDESESGSKAAVTSIKRPLTKLNISYIPGSHRYLNSPRHISRPTLTRMEKLIKAGIDLKILGEYNLYPTRREDFITNSQEFRARWAQEIDSKEEDLSTE